MKRFLKKLALFVTIILSLATAGQILIGIRIKGKSVRGHDNLHIVKNQQNDIVFLGSSRCLTHFDPHLFEQKSGLKAVNIGVEGHSELPVHILRLEDYLLKNKAPKFAILNFDPLMYAGSFRENTNFVHKDDFARYAFLCPAEDTLFINYFRFSFADRYIPLYALLKYKLFFDCLTLRNVSAWPKYGYARNDTHWDTLSNPVNMAFVENYFDTTSASLARMKVQLDSLNTLCRQNGIKLICIQTPMYKAVHIKPYYDLTGQLCHEMNIPFFDLNSDSLDNNVGYFYNIDHLNTEGVEVMTNNLFADEGFLRQLGEPLLGRR